MTKTVYECPECGDRKLVSHSPTIPPTIWCPCPEDDIVAMNKPYYNTDE